MKIAGRVRPEDGLTDTEWVALAHNAELISRAVLGESGVRTVLHPHCGTPVETFAETQRLAELTDPDLVGLCYDTGHVMYGGDDPLHWLQEFQNRVRLVHFKDMDVRIGERARKEEWDYPRAVRGGLFTELGQGGIDFKAIVAALTGSGYDGWVIVEDEIPPGRVPPLEAAKRDRDFLRGLGL
jgi:inosose dehydratase